MGFRFRKSFKIAPGLRVNVGKRGMSLSAGVRGARVTVGTSRVTASAGVPGTGISFVESKSLLAKSSRARSETDTSYMTPKFSGETCMAERISLTALGNCSGNEA